MARSGGLQWTYANTDFNRARAEHNLPLPLGCDRQRACRRQRGSRTWRRRDFYDFSSAYRCHDGSASDVSVTGATVSGTINPMGTDTQYHFDYGTDTTYGNQAPVPDGEVGSDSVEHSLTQTLTGLAPSTTYHYRLVAVIDGFPVDGADATFTTSPVCGLAVTGPSTVTLEGGFGKALVDLADPSVVGLWLRQPDGTVSPESLVSADPSSGRGGLGYSYFEGGAPGSGVTTSYSSRGSCVTAQPTVGAGEVGTSSQ